METCWPHTENLSTRAARFHAKDSKDGFAKLFFWSGSLYPESLRTSAFVNGGLSATRPHCIIFSDARVEPSITFFLAQAKAPNLKISFNA